MTVTFLQNVDTYPPNYTVSHPRIPILIQLAVPRFRRLVAGLYLRMLGFNPRPVHVGVFVDEMAIGQIHVHPPPPQNFSLPLSVSVNKCFILCR
jgi:hypothetical protein